MTNEKTNQPQRAKNQFLPEVKTRLKGYIDELMGEWDSETRGFVLETIYPFVETVAKESFKNGAEAGRRQATQGRPAGTDRQTRPDSQDTRHYPTNKPVDTPDNSKSPTQTY